MSNMAICVRILTENFFTFDDLFLALMHYILLCFLSEYSFAEKVVEGITVSVNSIVIRIGAKAFNASFELSQLRIYSVNANWEHGDLRFTRIQDPQRGEVKILFFFLCLKMF